MSKYLTLVECEKLTGIHIDTLRRNARNGGLIADRTGGDLSAWRVRQKDLDAFVQKRKNGPSFDIFPGGLTRRKPKKNAPSVTHDQIDVAMQEFLANGGQVECQTPEEEKESTQRVRINTPLIEEEQ